MIKEIKELLTQSKEMSHEYCCTIVRLGEILPIEGATSVAKTMVNGREIVIGKNQKEGDLMIYASNECQLNEDFLSVNNLFEDITHNRNYEEVQTWLNEHTDASEDEVKTYLQAHRGYFDKRARVRMKKLCKTMSMGFLFNIENLAAWCPALALASEDDWKALVGFDFDTVGGELLVKAYVPETKEHHTGTGANKRDKKLKKFNRMIPGQFSFHYDTQQFERCVDRFTPDEHVTISVKLHGTSAIIGNLKVKQPRWTGLYEKMFCYLPKFLQFTKEGYDIVRSSRSVIINDAINPNRGIGFSGGQVQQAISAWAERIGKYIPQGMTIYGEIIGYYEGSNSFIQKIGNGFDYGSKPGDNQLMIYRISQMQEDGTKIELNPLSVKTITLRIKDALQEDGKTEIANRLRPIDILYNGTLRDLYPDLDTETHWHENLLERMKKEDRFGMEKNEPFCKIQVPREGIVIRKDDDVIPEAFKLKCMKFLGKEAEAIDSGQVDAEMEERY